MTCFKRSSLIKLLRQSGLGLHCLQFHSVLFSETLLNTCISSILIQFELSRKAVPGP